MGREDEGRRPSGGEIYLHRVKGCAIYRIYVDTGLKVCACVCVCIGDSVRTVAARAVAGHQQCDGNGNDATVV